MKKITFIALSVLGLLFFFSGVKSQGNLIIIPRRVVFEGSKRTQELNLANTGKDTAKYLISIIQYRMNDDGTFENIIQPDSGQNFADKNFRFFPRSVVLAPNEAQTVKVQIINASDLKPGEYRSHLYFRSVPNDKLLGATDTANNTKTISVHLTPIFGMAIPVIIRTGVSTSNIVLNLPSLEIKENQAPKLKLAFNRSGNTSVYGDIKVDYISQQGQVTQVALAKGFAIYAPNGGRHFCMTLDNTKDLNYHKGKLHVTYTTPSDTKSVKIAEAELVLI